MKYCWKKLLQLPLCTITEHKTDSSFTSYFQGNIYWKLDIAENSYNGKWKQDGNKWDMKSQYRCQVEPPPRAKD